MAAAKAEIVSSITCCDIKLLMLKLINRLRAEVLKWGYLPETIYKTGAACTNANSFSLPPTYTGEMRIADLDHSFYWCQTTNPNAFVYNLKWTERGQLL